MGFCCFKLLLEVRTSFRKGNSSLRELWLSYHKGFHALGPKDLLWALVSWERDHCIRLLRWLLLCVNMTELWDGRYLFKHYFGCVCEGVSEID